MMVKKSSGPLDAIIDGHVLRVESNQSVQYPDTAIITPSTDVDAYNAAIDAAEENGDPVHDIGTASGGAYAAVRHLPDAGPSSYWKDTSSPNEPWADDITCYVGYFYTFDGEIWNCIQGHNTQSDWTPPTVPALFTRVRVDLAPWVQPAGSHDAYQLNERVTHDAKQWTNDGSEDNVWEPGVFGWTEM